MDGKWRQNKSLFLCGGGIGRRLIANVGIRLNNNPDYRCNVDVDIARNTQSHVGCKSLPTYNIKD